MKHKRFLGELARQFASFVLLCGLLGLIYVGFALFAFSPLASALVLLIGLGLIVYVESLS